MGNEFYNGIANEHADHESVFPTAKAYADTCNVWANKLKQLLPDVKIAIVGAESNSNDNPGLKLEQQFNCKLW